MSHLTQDGLFSCIHSCTGHHAGLFAHKLLSGKRQSELLLFVEISSSTSSLAGGVRVNCAGSHSDHPGDRGGQRVGGGSSVHQPSPEGTSESLPGVPGVGRHPGGDAGHPLLPG